MRLCGSGMSHLPSHILSLVISFFMSCSIMFLGVRHMSCQIWSCLILSYDVFSCHLKSRREVLVLSGDSSPDLAGRVASLCVVSYRVLSSLDSDAPDRPMSLAGCTGYQ